MPPTVPIDHDCRPENQQNRTNTALFHYSMLTYSKRPACLEHSNLFKVNVPNSPTAAIKSRRSLREHREPPGSARLSADRTGRARRTPATETPGPANWTRTTPSAGNGRGPRNPTTSFLTATTLIYAIGAGITAAAGTRLALQLFLVKGFGLDSFQLPDHFRDRHCYLLSLPPRVGIG